MPSVYCRDAVLGIRTVSNWVDRLGRLSCRCLRASAAMVSLWSQGLLELQDKGLITGFALITPQGASQPVTGAFAEECSQGISAAIRNLVKPFYQLGDTPASYELWGSKLFVIDSSDSYYTAISKQRKVGLLAINLPGGVLLASFDSAVQPTAAVAAVKDACAAAFAGGS